MKRIATLALIALLALSFLAALGESGTSDWQATTEEGLMDALGLALGVPKGATDVSWRMRASAQLGQVCFTLEDVACQARVMPAEAFEDITGLSREWTREETCAVGRCEGVLRFSPTEVACLWYDARTGLMYALCAGTADAEQLGILDVAEAVYVPVETE